MIKKIAVLISAFVLCFGMLATVPVSAQPTEATAKQASLKEHSQQMAGMMKEMSDELRKMMKDMKGEDVTSVQMKQMDKHMQRITNMMGRLSGTHDQMLKEMDEMKRDPTMKSPVR